MNVVFLRALCESSANSASKAKGALEFDAEDAEGSHGARRVKLLFVRLVRFYEDL